MTVDWPFASVLRGDERSAFDAIAVRRSFRRGEVLFHAGERGESYHLIEQGSVAVRAATPHGEVTILNVLGIGDGFGELALVGTDPSRSATVQALEDTTTRAVHRGDFARLVDRHPGVARILVDLLAAEVRRLSVRVVDVLHATADQRVLRCVHQLATVYARVGVPIRIPLTQEELATMAGTTRPTVNRVLNELVGTGIAKPGRGRIVVTDPIELAALVRPPDRPSDP